MNKKLRGLLLQVEVMEGSEIKVLNKNTFEVIRRYGVTADYLMTDQDILANDWIIASSKVMET